MFKSITFNENGNYTVKYFLNNELIEEDFTPEFVDITCDTYVANSQVNKNGLRTLKIAVRPYRK